MSPDTKANVAPEEEVAAKKQEVVGLLDDIERVALKEVDEKLSVAVSHSVRFLHNGDHFGLYAFKRMYSAGHPPTRGVVMDAYRGERAIPHYPPIYLNVVSETGGRITADDNLDSVEVGNPVVLDRQIGTLRFLKEQLPTASYDREPLSVVPGEVSSVADRLWNGKKMAFERAKDEFYEAANPLRSKSRRVKANPNKYENSGAIVTRQTKWVTIQVGSEPRLVRYQQYDAYSNGSWTDFERVVEKGTIPGSSVADVTLFDFYDVSRDGFNFFGKQASTAKAVKRYTKILKDINAALENKSLLSFEPTADRYGQDITESS